MTGLASDFEDGQLVELQDRRRAVVRYVGDTLFAPGLWIGVELDLPTGKNDGAVQGERYFACEPGHGMFVRPPTITAVEREASKTNGKPHGGTTAKTSRGPGNTPSKRQSTTLGAAERRQSASAQAPTATSRLLRVSETIANET